MHPHLIEHAERLLDRLCETFPIGYRPSLVWKGLRVSAGMAYFRAKTIGLSRNILDTEEKLEITLKHEYAHLMAYARHGRKGVGHGDAWKQAMADLGVKAEVRHRYEVLRNEKRQQVSYLCTRCGILIHRTRRLPKRRKYIHVNCGGMLKLQAIRRLDEAP